MTFKDSDALFEAMTYSREPLLRRYMLYDRFLSFVRRFEEYKTSPSRQNRLEMLNEIKPLASLLDAAARKIGGLTKT
jgi:hypothetical protein